MERERGGERKGRRERGGKKRGEREERERERNKNWQKTYNYFKSSINENENDF